MTAQPPARRVYLFVGELPLAMVTTTEDAPEKHYEVDGVLYQAIFYTEITEQGGVRGFEVQVRPTIR